MYRHLVRTIRSRFPHYLTQPFSVAELHQTILPYRLHRRELGLETNDDYESTLTELLSGERGYLIVDDRMRDALRADLASVNPDPAAFKQFASATVALSPTALRSLEAGPDDDESNLGMPTTPRASGAVTSPTVAAATPTARVSQPVSQPPAPTPRASQSTAQPQAPPSFVAPPADVLPPRRSSVETAAITRPSTPSAAMGGVRTIMPQPGDRCRSCNEELPAGRPITFCPHCGQNLTTKTCPACGSELELGWRFCPTCGRPADQA
jgi:hypothetical protein